jgi:hypothetical protein
MSESHRARVRETERYWRYYRGQQPQQLKIKSGQPDWNVTENWARLVVNTSVDFLFSGGLSFDVEGAEPDSPAQVYIDAVWGDAPLSGFNFGEFLQEVGQSGANGRNALIRIVTGDELPRLVNVDPDLVEITTDPRDIEKVTEYKILWEDDGRVFRQRIIRGDGDGWEIIEEEYGGHGSWGVVGDAVEWPYEFPPMFHCKNMPLAHSVWGPADLEDYNLQDAINRTGSDINKILGYWASPQGWIKGAFRQDSIKADPDVFLPLPSDGDIGFLELSGDLTASRGYKSEEREAFLQITDTPLLDKDSTSVGAMSGFALKILLGAALRKANRKRMSYGGLFSQVNTALLAIGGYETAVVKNVWGDMLPENKAETVNMIVALAAQGVSVEAAAEFVGVNREEAEALAAASVMLPSVSPIAEALGVANV